MKYTLPFLIGLLGFCFSTYADLPPKKSTSPKQTKLPGLVINQTDKTLEIQSKVVLRDADWLELLLCSSGTKEHESILSTKARPSHIHLGLIMIGLKPGNPMTGKKVDDKMQITAAKGPLVSVELSYQKNGKTITVPANQWIYDKTTKQTMQGNQWLFAGSNFIKAHDQSIYRADANGSVITLVHFGDDLLARKTKLTSRNDNAQWQAQTKLIPPVGTPVIIRLSPFKDQNKNTN